MHKRGILDLSKEIMIRRTPKEYEPDRAESENESFKSMRNIQIENNVKKKTGIELKKGVCDDI